MVTPEQSRALKQQLVALSEARRQAQVAGDFKGATRLGNEALTIQDQLMAGREDLK